MPDQDIKFKLEELLGTLKRNKEKVPITELKTKYKKGFESLCKEISETSSLFAKQIVFKNMRIHKDLLDEAVPIVEEAIQKSGYLKKLSVAAYCYQDIEELESLALSLRELIIKDLEPFYAKHICLYLTEECLEEPYQAPLIYNAASGCIWDGKWSMVREFHFGILLYNHDMKTLYQEKPS